MQPPLLTPSSSRSSSHSHSSLSINSTEPNSTLSRSDSHSHSLTESLIHRPIHTHTHSLTDTHSLTQGLTHIRPHIQLQPKDTTYGTSLETRFRGPAWIPASSYVWRAEVQQVIHTLSLTRSLTHPLSSKRQTRRTGPAWRPVFGDQLGYRRQAMLGECDLILHSIHIRTHSPAYSLATY